MRTNARLCLTLAAACLYASASPAAAQSLEALAAGAGALALPGAPALNLPARVGVRPAAPAAVAPAAVSGGSQILLTEPNDGRDRLLGLITGARSSIDLTIYTISDTQVIAALGAAAQRGVQVRVIYNYYSFQNRPNDPNAAGIAKLSAAGVQTKPASQSFAITHQKTFVVDGSAAVVMSFNLSASYFKSSRDFGIVTTDPGQVSEISQGFEADWNGTSFSPSNPGLVWSPNNSRQRILDVINGATSSLDIYGEEAADQQSMQALMAAARRGVSVRFITAVLRSATGGDGNAAERQVLNQNGVQAKSTTSLYIHAKMVLADYGTGSAKAFLGSENFSSTSLDKNRELGIIVTDSGILSSLEGTFTSDWGSAQ